MNDENLRLHPARAQGQLPMLTGGLPKHEALHTRGTTALCLSEYHQSEIAVAQCTLWFRLCIGPRQPLTNDIHSHSECFANGGSSGSFGCRCIGSRLIVRRQSEMVEEVIHGTGQPQMLEPKLDRVRTHTFSVCLILEDGIFSVQPN